VVDGVQQARALCEGLPRGLVPGPLLVQDPTAERLVGTARLLELLVGAPQLLQCWAGHGDGLLKPSPDHPGKTLIMSRALRACSALYLIMHRHSLPCLLYGRLIKLYLQTPTDHRAC
jgi:hypothetical protein